MITAKDLHTKIRTPHANPFNTLPSEALAKAAHVTRRALLIKEIVRLSDPPNPELFARHLENWRDQDLQNRLNTLQDQAVHHPNLPSRDLRTTLANIAALGLVISNLKSQI
jgi:hypothetical protein